jgi:hypothetical protein
MNAIELYHQDGKSTGVFYCTTCRCVKRTKEEADKCCEPTKCQYCGKESGRQHYLACESCDRANQAKKEADRFEKAEKKTEWDGWVYLEGTGRDGYSESVEAFWDNWECAAAADDEKPKYAWACKKNFFAVADVSDITERIADNGYEDFDPDDLNGLDDLKAAIEKFNEANKDVVSYEPDYSIAILLNAQAQRPADNEKGTK